MKDWVAYYDSDHSIYVNARHRNVHYARLAEAIASYVPSRAAAVLDYGCGEALHADRVADAAGWLALRRRSGADTHVLFRLSAVASEGRADPLQRAGDDWQAGGGRLQRDPGAGQPWPPRNEDDVPGAKKAGSHAAGGVRLVRAS